MGKVYYKKLVEGVSVPAIIHNGGYFLIQMAVYEDGTVSCWHRSDLEEFRKEMKKGWVVPSVPTGKFLSVHKLGGFAVLDARWDYRTKEYYQHILDTIRILNPEMENLYHTTRSQQEKWEKAKVRWAATPIPCKLKSGYGYGMLDGDSGYIFYRMDKKRYLTPLTAYGDGTIQIDAAKDRSFTLEEISRFFQDGTLCTSPETEEWICIPGLGEILLEPAEKPVTAKDKQGEIADTIARLAGEPDSLERCRDAHYQYLCRPGDWERKELHRAYEAVPEHLRMYLGDMDTRDSDFRRILHHPEQKREV